MPFAGRHPIAPKSHRKLLRRNFFLQTSIPYRETHHFVPGNFHILCKNPPKRTEHSQPGEAYSYPQDPSRRVTLFETSPYLPYSARVDIGAARRSVVQPGLSSATPHSVNGL